MQANFIKSVKKKIIDVKDNFIWTALLFLCISIVWKYLPILIPMAFGYAGEVGETSWIYEAGDTLFSALAFGAMIITLWLQRKDLKLQNREIQTTTKIMSKQLDLAGTSQLESALFYMLGQHNNILNSLSSEISNGRGGMLYVTVKGIEYINHLNDRIEPPHVYYLNDSERINVSPYINNLMQIFKYIDETEVLKSDDVDDEFEKRHRYCSMVTSSLSNNELILIEYYLSIYTGIELNRLCDIYALLENRKYPDGRKLNGPRYNIDVAKGYFKTDRERKIKEGKRK